ncbi:MAG: M20 metallopeptidase family protein [Bacteroidia bacterium]
MPQIEEIKKLAQEILPDIIRIRRHIHTNPELSFYEENTAQFVEEELRKIGLKPFRMANTGVIALLEGKNPAKKTIALRSELDALPILEKTNAEYKSVHEGIMHACGHDVHTSSLLGAARILSQFKDQFEGTIKFIFQPGEEKLPGGASMLIHEGVLENPAPNYMLAQHVQTEIPAGKVGFRKGLYMASTDEIYITVKGKGGHGAMPHLNIDPVLITAHLIIALQQVVSRWSKPQLPTVLSIGKVIADGATNVIPDVVKLEGTFRTFNEEWRFEAHNRMREMAKGLVESMGGEVDFDIQVGYPFLHNDEALTERMHFSATQYMGAENVIDLDLRTTAEDFAFYTHHVPACFYRLGTGNPEKGITASVHNPYFDIDEGALEIGSGLMAWLALEELRSE